MCNKSIVNREIKYHVQAISGKRRIAVDSVYFSVELLNKSIVHYHVYKKRFITCNYSFWASTRQSFTHQHCNSLWAVASCEHLRPSTQPKVLLVPNQESHPKELHDIWLLNPATLLLMPEKFQGLQVWNSFSKGQWVFGSQVLGTRGINSLQLACSIS